MISAAEASGRVQAGYEEIEQELGSSFVPNLYKTLASNRGYLTADRYDMVLSAFTFDNIPTTEKKVAIFQGLKGLLSADGLIVNLVSSPEICVNEWVSFSTKEFPENRIPLNGLPGF